MSKKPWVFVGMWNQALALNPPRVYEPRDYIWASELGGSFYDRYFKMKGRKPTTPPNLRSRRKFEGGNLTEWIVMQILARAGVLTASQEYITYEGSALKVTGRADLRAGGDIKEVVKGDMLDFPDTFAVMAESVIAQLREKYNEGLQDVNLEIKSCAGQMFDRYRKAPNKLHALQAFHYAYNTKRPTILIYVSRDDFRIAEWVILPGSRNWLNLYEEDIVDMANILTLSEKEVKAKYKEPLLAWDGEKFQKNWKIEYSNYLTDYGYRRPDLYADKAGSIARRLTNIVKKIREDKPIDGKVNVQTLEECYQYYPGAEAIINKYKETHNGSTSTISKSN